MGGLVAATKVSARPDGTTFDCHIDPQWTVAGKPHGGYLMTMLANAAIESIAASGQHPHPLAASAHFLAAPDVGPAVIEVTLLRQGRSASQLRTGLRQGERLCVEALFTLGRLDVAAPVWEAEPPVPLPTPEGCVQLPAEPPGASFRVNYLDELQVRLDPAVLGFAEGRFDATGELRGWLVFGDGDGPDPIGLLFAVDALPPATFTIALSGWVPTLELTTYVRAVPAPGALRVRQRARIVAGGRVDEVCDVWDSRGRLVAQAMQLASVRLGG
jgi:acyl-coenzyme A thioesterase PaaI-like protein